MKKFKILTVFGILLAMGITACNKGGDNSGDAQKSGDAASVSEQQSGGGASEHTHKWGSWSVIPGQEPTCTEPGKEQRSCKECDAVETRDKAALNHDFANGTPVAGTDTSTCTVDGEQDVKCARCEATTKVAVKAHHRFGDPADVAAAGDGVAHTKEVCSATGCGAVRLVVNQSKVTYVSGSRKNGTPEGYTKLGNDGNVMSFKFNYTHFAIGDLYLFGCMDGYSTDSNKAAGLYRNNEPSVEIKVNGSVVDMSAQKSTKYSDIFGDEAIETGLDSPSNYLSNEGYFPVGPVVLQEGVNELIYKRVQTQNMLIKDFVFVIKDSEHSHVAATAWSSDENGHWHACTAPGCPTGKADAVVAHTFEEVAAESVAPTCSAEGKKVEKCSVCDFKKETKLAKIAHTFPADGGWTQNKAATCTEDGERQHTCSVCSEIVKEAIPALGHDFGDAVENYAAGDGYIATTAHNCSRCNVSSLRWSAKSFDTTLSDSGLENNSDNIRFKSGSVENKGGTEGVGSHVIYKINSPVAMEKAGLSFKIKNTNGNNGNADVFGPVTNDTSIGYIKQADGTLVESTHRYGIRVNDVEYFLGDNSYGNQSGVTGWFTWPVEFPLVAGVNKIDIFAYRGYRANMYEFQLIGFDHVTPSHIHNGEDTWLSDENNHWHVCSADGCPIADHIYGKQEHDWNDVVVTTPATCTEAGAGTKECKVCHKVVDVVIPAKGHTLGAAQTKIGDATPYECTVCHAMMYELAVASPAKLKSDLNWNITGLPAGNYEIQLFASAASTTLPQKYDSRYQFSVDGGTTYIGASDDNATYADYGLGTGEKLDTCVWSKTINTIAVADTTTQFTLHWTNKGYSAFIGGVRLVKVA